VEELFDNLYGRKDASLWNSHLGLGEVSAL
jgi:hypothetical protein